MDAIGAINDMKMWSGYKTAQICMVQDEKVKIMLMHVLDHIRCEKYVD